MFFSENRARPGATVRQRLPYGFWQTQSGDEVLFDRRYRPLLRRTPDGVVTREAPDRWIEGIVRQRWLYDDSVDLRTRKQRVAKALADWGIGA
jgi:hypothetical protein